MRENRNLLPGSQPGFLCSAVPEPSLPECFGWPQSPPIPTPGKRVPSSFPVGTESLALGSLVYFYIAAVLS